jgi:hypothetical protein
MCDRYCAKPVLPLAYGGLGRQCGAGMYLPSAYGRLADIASVQELVASPRAVTLIS